MENAWHLDRVEITPEGASRPYVFHAGEGGAPGVGAWFSSEPGQRLRRVLPVANGDLRMVKYRVQVQTGAHKYAGTDASVSVTLYGADKASGKETKSRDGIRLMNSPDNFSKGRLDSFVIGPMLDLGELRKIRIGHDNSGSAAGWLLDHVEARRTAACALLGWMGRLGGGVATGSELLPAPNPLLLSADHPGVRPERPGSSGGGGEGPSVLVLPQRAVVRRQGGPRHCTGERAAVNARAAGGRARERLGESQLLNTLPPLPPQYIEAQPKPANDGTKTGYYVVVKTSPARNAGTDAQVWINIVGKQGETGALSEAAVGTRLAGRAERAVAITKRGAIFIEHALTPRPGRVNLANDRENFERGRTDNFPLQVRTNLPVHSLTSP